DLPNPHLITPGTRLRIIMKVQVPTAEIRGVSRRVEEKPHPDPWVPARVGDKLKARDGIRTYRQSSAELGFEDGSQLRINEDALVFRREVCERQEGASRQSLEVVEGQADVQAEAVQGAGSPDIEVIIGQATSHTRARKRTPL